MEEFLIEILGPIFLTAVAVGAVVYPFRFWGKWKDFGMRVGALGGGLVFGLLADNSLSGVRTGLVVGGLALPAIGFATRRFNAPVRSEHTAEPTPAPERKESEEVPQ